MNAETVAMLTKDLQDEHGAIIQYLIHAYAMGEGALACDIEAISREEMRHFDWLAQAIVNLGGQPALERGAMRLGGAEVPEWMKNDVLLEADAIAQYEAHIKAVSEPGIKRLLSRIVLDERAHQGMFQRYVEKSAKLGLKDLRRARQDKLAEALNRGVDREYTATLQYLFHSYMARDQRVKDELDDQAVNEMQHMGWLAERLVECGGNPKMEHSRVDRSVAVTDMLWADIKMAPETAAEYDRAINDVSDPGIKELLSRIRNHEMHHERVFSDLLKEVQK